MKAWECPVPLRVSNMDVSYGAQSVEWRERARHRGEDPFLHNSKNTMHIVFHVKSIPWNCVMPHLDTQIFFCPQTQEIPGSGFYLGSVPSLLLAWSCHSEPKWGTKSLIIRIPLLESSHLMMSSSEISLTGSSCQHISDSPDLLHYRAELQPESVPKCVSAAEFQKGCQFLLSITTLWPYDLKYTQRKKVHISRIWLVWGFLKGNQI